VLLQRIVALLIAIVTFFANCFGITSLNMVPYAELRTELDDSIPLLTGDHSEELLTNIDRGVRMEVYLTLGPGCAIPGTQEDAYDFLDTCIEKYAQEAPREAQVYIYLNEYFDHDLDEAAFTQLREYLEYVRSRDLGILLRFAYEPSPQSEYAPTQEQMLRHITQIKNWMRENETLIGDVVTALQLGFIGAWGEWGSSLQEYDRKQIANAICDMVPKNVYIQGRYMDVTAQMFGRSTFPRVGYHSDFMVGRPHPWNTAYDKYYAPYYWLFAATSAHRINDGEMPWVGATEEPDEYVDGQKFLQQCYEYHLSTFSIEHNYRDTHRDPPNEPVYNIARWQTEELTLRDAKKLRIPYFESWFQDEDGNAIRRTVYEYLRDFLGYQLALSNLEIKATRKGMQVSLMMTNFGLGTPLTLDSAELVVRNRKTGEETRYALGGFNTGKLTTYGQVTLKATVKEELADCDLGVAVTRARSTGDYRIRCANNIPFADGVNWIQ